MRAESDLRGYQVRMVNFLLKKLYAALLVDMGLGKTISVLTAIVRLLKRDKIDNVLVVAPVRVVYGVWRQEAKLWRHTRSLKFSVVHGSPNERLAALKKPAHIYLINPEGLMWLKEVYKNRPWPFDMLVVDESSMFKQPKVKRFRALRSGLRYFKRRVIMTGTPTPNSLLELWTQMYIVDGGHALGETYTIYKENHFHRTGYMGYKLEPNPGSEEIILRAIAPRTVSLRSEDWLELPPLMNIPVWVDLPPEVRRLYERVERELYMEFEEGELDILNSASLSNSTSQIANGAVWLKGPEGEETRTKIWRPLHDVKLNAIREIVDELQGEPPLIGYRFQHDLERLRAMFPKFTVIGKGSPPKQIVRVEKDWNSGKLPGIIAHPSSAGHGLNLQRGGRHVIWFGLTWSLEQYLQFLKRIYRSGVRGSVMNYLILARRTTDEAIFDAIGSKNTRQNRVKLALRNYFEEMYG